MVASLRAVCRRISPLVVLLRGCNCTKLYDFCRCRAAVDRTLPYRADTSLLVLARIGTAMRPLHTQGTRRKRSPPAGVFLQIFCACLPRCTRPHGGRRCRPRLRAPSGTLPTAVNPKCIPGCMHIRGVFFRRLPLHCASRHHQQNPVALSAGERQKRPLSRYGWTLTRRGYATTFFTSPSTILSAPSHRPSRRG